MIGLDGCCGAGGATRGYADAGHVMTGLDSVPQPRYLKSGAASFIQADILEFLGRTAADRRAVRRVYDFIHVSPPCQRGSKMTNCRPGLAASYPDLVGQVRELLDATGLPYVIEQPEHGIPLRDPVTLCGWMFGYETYRHRCFEAGGGLVLAAPPAPPEDMPGRRRQCGWPHPVPAAKAGHWVPGKFVSIAGNCAPVAKCRQAMAIGWTNREELAEAIPPYMTRWIGEQL